MGTTRITKSNGKAASFKFVLSDMAINNSANTAHATAPTEEYTHLAIGTLTLTRLRCIFDIRSFLFTSTADWLASYLERDLRPRNAYPFPTIVFLIGVLAAVTVTAAIQRSGNEHPCLQSVQ